MKIKITKHQARIIEMALDTLSRMTMGQLKEIIWGIERARGKIFEGYYKRSLAEQIIMKKVKPLLFPELAENASHGVGGKGNAQIMYEMVKCLQNYRSKDMSDEDAGVLKHKPLHYSDEPLIEIEDNKMIYFINFVEQPTDSEYIKGSVEVYSHYSPSTKYKACDILVFDFNVNKKEYYKLKEKWHLKQITENKFKEFKKELYNKGEIK